MILKYFGVLVGLLLVIPNGSSTQGPGIGLDDTGDCHQSVLHLCNQTDSPVSNDLIIRILQNTTQSLYLNYLENFIASGPGPRFTGTLACYNASTYLYHELKAMNLSVQNLSWTSGGYTDRNIEATLPGVDNPANEIYIICAHFDTAPLSPGADDDGSGVAAVLSAAYLLRQYRFNHTIKFVFFSGEEQHFLGSSDYAADAVINGDNILGVLNADMIGFAVNPGDGTKLIVYENTVSEPLYVVTNTTCTEYSTDIGLTLIHGGFYDGSDHTPFWQRGFRALWYLEYHFNPYYHDQDDTIDRLNITYAVHCSRLLLATLAVLADIKGNTPPENPDSPVGPTDGDINIEYMFSTQTVDQDSEEIYYQWCWGVETSEWMGPYASGTSVQALHLWTTYGTYEITARAKDSNDAVSNWSEPHVITIHGNPIIEIGDITGGFGIQTELKNTGVTEAINVSWKISIQGLLFIGQETNGSYVKIPTGFTVIARTGFLLGFGPIDVTVTAVAEGLTSVQKQVTAFLLGPFVFRVR